MTKIRLACFNCDRGDQDGITPEQLQSAVAAGWQYVDEVLADDGPIQWWTHLGWCPDCLAGMTPVRREMET